MKNSFLPRRRRCWHPTWEPPRLVVVEITNATVTIRDGVLILAVPARVLG